MQQTLSRTITETVEVRTNTGTVSRIIVSHRRSSTGEEGITIQLGGQGICCMEGDDYCAQAMRISEAIRRIAVHPCSLPEVAP